MVGDTTTLHPVVTLLIARMRSHPDEFIAQRSRWGNVLNRVRDTARGEDAEALTDALYVVEMSALHHEIMDRLLTDDPGSERESPGTDPVTPTESLERYLKTFKNVTTNSKETAHTRLNSGRAL